jgi:steroid 5-alpha reductase family enzyme
VETGYPDMSGQPVLGRRNLANLALVLVVPLPAVLFSAWLFDYFPAGAIPPDPGLSQVASVHDAAAVLLHHPILTVNLVFFVNVCVIFWILALLQGSSWLIDPYWTLIPPLIAWFYCAHPLADPSPARSLLTFGLLAVWSVRLTHNYLRRERFRLGFREDWRFAKRRQESRHFWLFQFFYIYVAQQLMLVGLTLPFFAIQFRYAPLSPWDALLAGLALAGIAIAHLADTSLHRFMQENAARVARGQPREPLLDVGIWCWSRHPNYFGEQLFWWAIAGYGVLLGEPFVVVGALLNSIVLAAVTVMTERRMLADPARSELFRAYRERTSVWVPWLGKNRAAPSVDPGSARR